MLLGFKPIHIDGKLGGSYNIGQKNEFPARELRAIAKIEIFTQRVMLPSPAFLDARASPEAGRSVEIEKAAAPAARSLLEQKMHIQEERLHPGEQRISTIQMAPPRLNHPYFRVGKEMDRAL